MIVSKILINFCSFQIKLNLSDIYLHRFHPPKFDTKHALKIMSVFLGHPFDCCALNWCGVKRFFFSISLLTILDINFLSNCCFVKIMRRNLRY